jgi:hypothetical protein
MGQGHEGVIGHTPTPCHGLGGLDESVRDNGRRGNSSFFEQDTVEQTARTAGSSISYASYHCVALGRQFNEDLLVGRDARVELAANHVASGSIFLL